MRNEAEATFYEAKVAAELGYTWWQPYEGTAATFPSNPNFKSASSIMYLASRMSAPTADVINKLMPIVPNSYYQDGYNEYVNMYGSVARNSSMIPLAKNISLATVAQPAFLEKVENTETQDIPTSHSMIQAMTTFGSSEQTTGDVLQNQNQNSATILLTTTA